MSNSLTDILIRVDGKIGRMTLQRPTLLNALSHKMTVLMAEALSRWGSDPKVDLVLIDAVGSRAFCAGGDVQDLYRQGQAGDFKSGASFWRDEYHLNAQIKNYNKPIVVVMDGITMGGGVGIGCHASHRIVTENALLALPECSIGLIPDVGSTHLLASAPDHLGEFLALTGYRLTGPEAVYAGFADYLIPAIRLHKVLNELTSSGDVSAIRQSSDVPTVTKLEEITPEISTIFALNDVNEIIIELGKISTDWAATAHKKINQSSPLSCNVAFKLVRKSRRKPGIEHALVDEFRFVSRAMEHGDFIEGLRANIIDKDRKPNWLHRSFADVPENLVASMTSEAIGGDLIFEQKEKLSCVSGL